MNRLVVLVGEPCVVRNDIRVTVPQGSHRLLALVALAPGPVGRRRAAARLWPDANEVRATGNLRTALWRLRGAGADVIHTTGTALRLADGVDVDCALICAWAQRLVAGVPTPEDLEAVRLPRDPDGLLPGWDDDWVVVERERVRQRVLHGLEAFSRVISGAGRHGDAVEAAMIAVAADPLRESAHRALIEAHRGEGNVVEAQRALARCCDVFRRELRLDPSRRLLSPLETAGGRAG